ncbi:2-isopropylmalate synthase [Oceanithermus sp.]|uniref:2-isopropylmalate synthase n=3 Tax=Oceanithermus sp. TaxID=2268145 RepID=UPI00260016EB|nr:2-isopropylmalate synthase [Oceanithermus sp.]
MRRIKIFDTTLRDGEQSPGVALSPDEKLAIAKQLARLGVDVIEAGFPIASPGDFDAVRRIAEEVKGPTIAALARTAKPDIERAAEAVAPAEKRRIHTFIATSPVHMEKKLRMTPDEVVQKAVWAVKFAREFTDDVEFSAEDAGRSDPDFLVRIFGEAIAAGATTINIPDTVGYQVPWKFAELVGYIIENTPGADGVDWSVHTHDDLGMAVVNSLAAVRAGATQVECTINGIGERAGNASLEEVVMALYTRRDFFEAETGVNTRELYRTSQLVSRLTGMVVPPNKAIVGRNAFAHESGIHQDGVLKARETYEIMNAEIVGREAAVMVLGKHSGRHAFKKALAELGYEVDDEELKRLFARFKEIADRKKQVTSEDLVALVEDERTRAPEMFKLVDMQVHSGLALTPVATVRVKTPDDEVTEAATGDGPVDAVYKAISRAVGLSPTLERYRIEATTGGTEALGEVMVRLRQGTVVVTGRGIAPDIVESSARAYLDALNKLVSGVGAREVIETP